MPVRILNSVGTGLASEISTINPSGSPVRPITEEVPILKVNCWPNVGPVQKRMCRPFNVNSFMFDLRQHALLSRFLRTAMN